MMPPFVVFPTNRIAHFVEVSLYLFYLAQQVNLKYQKNFSEFFGFITNVHFVKATIDLSKEKQKRKTFENKKRRKRK